MHPSTNESTELFHLLFKKKNHSIKMINRLESKKNVLLLFIL